MKSDLMPALQYRWQQPFLLVLRWGSCCSALQSLCGSSRSKVQNGSESIHCQRTSGCPVVPADLQCLLLTPSKCGKFCRPAQADPTSSHFPSFLQLQFLLVKVLPYNLKLSYCLSSLLCILPACGRLLSSLHHKTEAGLKSPVAKFHGVSCTQSYRVIRLTVSFRILNYALLQKCLLLGWSR